MDKPRGRPFEASNQFGRGRPKGSRNRPKASDELLDRFEPQLMGECIRRALKEGDRTALRLCVERINPTRRGVPLSFKLPRIRSAQDAERAAEKVTQALQHGQCTPPEAIEVMRFLQAHAQLLQDIQMESRLDELEERIQGRE
ncbi:MAG TPA: hypothetical protein VIY49_07235 [Bryobacteraceae bacterium]